MSLEIEPLGTDTHIPCEVDFLGEDGYLETAAKSNDYSSYYFINS